MYRTTEMRDYTDSKNKMMILGFPGFDGKIIIKLIWSTTKIITWEYSLSKNLSDNAIKIKERQIKNAEF